MSKWNKGKPPKEVKRYLITARCNGGGNTFMAVGLWEKCERSWYWSVWGFEGWCEVLAWQELPEIFEEVKE